MLIVYDIFVGLQVLLNVELVLGKVVVLNDIDAGVGDLDLLLGHGGVGVRGHIGEGLQHIPATHDAAEDDVLVVEPASLGQRDVELGVVGVGSVVGHGDPAGAAVAQDELLVVEALAEDAATAAAVTDRDVSHLKDEVRHDTMHGGVLVVQLVTAWKISLI